jgi:hypothetical protein
MTRYADPNRCPDCGRTIVPEAPSCPACGLSLSGPLARQLFVTLTRADELLVTLRATPVARPPASIPALPPIAAPPARTPVRPRASLSAASVPKILLTLGAGCLLVAALVFLAVTWSVLGVGGRTAVLVGFTGVTAALTAWMARRRLRAAAESLALVAYGLLSLDVVGADNAGWFGDLSTTGLLVLLGGILTASGAAGALLVRRSSTIVLTGAEVVAAVGTGLAAIGLSDGNWPTRATAALMAVLLTAGVTALAQRAALKVTMTGAAAVTAIAWLALTDTAVERALEHATWSGLWLHLHVWPLLMSAALVGVLAAARRLPRLGRVCAAAVAHFLVTVAVVTPMLDANPTALSLLAVVVLALAAIGIRVLPQPWGLANALTQVVATVGVSVVLAELVSRAAGRLGAAAASAWAGAADDRLPEVAGESYQPAGWLLPLCVVALIATAHVLASATGRRDIVAVLEDRRLAAMVLASSLVATLAWYPVTLWVVLGALLLVAAAFAGWWLRHRSSVPLAIAAAFLAAGDFVALHSPGLTLAAVVVTLATSGLVHLRARQVELAAAGGCLFSAAMAAAIWTVGSLIDVAPVWVAFAGLLAFGVLVLTAPYAPRRWWSSQPVGARVGLELGAAVSATALGMVGAAEADRTATWTAGYLTLAGVVVTVMSLLRSDRRQAGWAGGALLALASWVRLWDLGVTSPEAYTLPSAGALLLVGLLHLRREPASSTVTALTPGLSLALVPSLLWALDEPYGVRVPLLGLACLTLVIAGARLRWTAPLAVGAVVGGLLVLRLAAPYVGDSVPHWALIGAAGALLIGVGVTWEQRMQDARDVLTYVRRLR